MITEIVNDLNELGFYKTNIFDLGLEKLFIKNKTFLENLIASEHVRQRADRLTSGNPIRDRKKFFELQNRQLLGRALSLQDENIIEIYLSDIFLDVANIFLGTDDPKMRNCLAFYHPQNPFPSSASQKWHRDQEDFKILKVFIYYNDVRKDNGCLWYTKSSAYGGRNDHIWPNMNGIKGNLDDKAISMIPNEDIIALEGAPGTVCFFNSNGFHRGGHAKNGHRLATHACFLSPNAPHIKNGVLPSFIYDQNEINDLDIESEKYKLLSERQKRVLG